ncbi:tRNA (adenosine(37)-N6)-threonylcarbamoyltransferase complex dimerization subunit type 1 TsaB [Ectobacillus ponti]|uniref:tRNA (Adenosine(37)-N6)-threonylcarbamoyltransferase complex dimerization subunit type 1 TsaB n=1 Tax=Ectobacillus ponti TaxID=2961894 RepID=A0AA42BT99_9BACI|nr:tRNA (adenosine(37)-N6)-threonylcarbamoyltransferase complex dimerization subunit type 1 TsaB [Ectobacillus ponti]MCP8971379.1 tRNA (adenosine(37)-N6)-threonylcarbamoyltransferase complex dimerization subunit type 1 TsaB [Ectobacillus ponti]
MKVLAIDTSNYTMSIAVLDGQMVLGELTTNLKKNHSVRLMPAIEQLLQECGMKPKELQKIVVADGPGSYTGVRIGVTVAKTLAWSLQIPITGVSSLEALAANGLFFPGYICPLFDARRQQVYTGLYKDEAGALQSVKPDTILIITDWLQQLKELGQPVLFVGSDVPLHREVIEQELGEQAVFAPISRYNPRAGELAVLGLQKPDEDIHSFVPNYIRLAEAEANWLASQGQGLQK